MKKQKKHLIAEKFTDRLELPRDLIAGDAIVNITGRSELTIENYKGILEYEPEKIRLSLKHGQMEIYGKSLKIKYYTNDDMRITGCIDRIEYGI